MIIERKQKLLTIQRDRMQNVFYGVQALFGVYYKALLAFSSHVGQLIPPSIVKQQYVFSFIK